MTIVPEMSASSIALRMAVTAAWSAPSRSPRPMSRAAAMAPASVARTASAMIELVAALGHRLERQCLKWRRPVKTIAMWWRSAASIAISSRMLPPGWMIAVTPAWAAIWMPSGNGK